MCTYFIIVDCMRRHFPEAFANPLGQFAVSSCAATTGFLLVWPAEVLKNQIQAHTPIYSVADLGSRGIQPHHILAASSSRVAVAPAPLAATATATAASSIAASSASSASASASVSSRLILPSPLSHPSTLDRVRYLYWTHGFAGLYRGIGPGTARSMLSNGCSMVVMLWAQKKITQWGWRD